MIDGKSRTLRCGAYLTSAASQEELLNDAPASGDARYVSQALGVIAWARGMTEAARGRGDATGAVQGAERKWRSAFDDNAWCRPSAWCHADAACGRYTLRWTAAGLAAVVALQTGSRLVPGVVGSKSVDFTDSCLASSAVWAFSVLSFGKA